MLVDAFNAVLRMHSRPATIYRLGGASFQARITPSNYFRNNQGPSEMVMEGREFIIPKHYMDGISYPGGLRRGDRISDADFGEMAIVSIIDIYDFGGALMGYRLQVG